MTANFIYYAVLVHLVECHVANVKVTGSNPVYRSICKTELQFGTVCRQSEALETIITIQKLLQGLISLNVGVA